MTGRPPKRPARAPARVAPPAAIYDADAPPMADDAQPWKKRRAPRKAPKGKRRDDAEANARAKVAKSAPEAAPAPASTAIPLAPSADPAVMAAIAQLRAAGDPERAASMAAYHKTARACFGAPNPAIDEAAKGWRADMAEAPDPLAARLSLAAGLWDAGGFETRIAAAKLLTQARIADDGPVWDLIASWVPQFDGWAIADAVASAGSRRLAADPTRLDDVEVWTRSAHMWTRRAALVFTLPFAKGRAASPARERALGWAATYAEDRDWFIQKAVAVWLRSLSIHDAPRVRAFMDAHGPDMKPFARKEALRLID